MVDLHGRLEPWKIAGYWVGDATALACFLWYVGSSLATGSRPIPAGSEVRQRRAAAVSLLIGLAVDVGVTWHISRAEDAGYDSGLVTTAEVVAVRRADAPYILDCRYVDAASRAHQGNLRVYENRGRPPAAGLGVWRPRDLRAKPVPLTIRVRYDPAWPRRFWADGAGTRNSNDLINLSHCAALFQGLMALLLFATPKGALHIRAGGVVPWHRAYNAVPLVIEACLLGFFGLLAGLGRLGLGP